MNRFISSIVLLVCCLWGLLPLNAQAQSYEQLWKQVEQARNKSLPQTVLKLTRRITDKAVREHQAGQLFKAAAAGQAAQERLTPDSLYTHLQALEQWPPPSRTA